MKRRVYFGLILCFALLICTLLLTACDQGEQPAIPGDSATLEQTETEVPEQTETLAPPAHVHEFGEWVVITEPLCGQNGERERACACGEVERETIAPTAAEHTYDTYNVCIACGQTMPYTQNLRFEETPDQKGYIVGASQMLTDKVIVVPPYYEGKPVVGILSHAFGGMTEIESFVLPDTIVTIGPSAFVGCTGLVSITLPGCVTEIGECAFERCTSLSEIYLSPNLEVVGSRAFAGCTAIEQMILPETVHTIGAGAFVGCGFKEFIIPPSVTQLGEDAFAACKSLEHVSVYASITVLPAHIFAKCTALRTIDLPLGLIAIGSSAFAQCALVEVILPDTVSQLEKGAFIDCKQLVAVVGGDLETVEQAFLGCTALVSKPHVHTYTEHLVRDPGCTENGVFMMACTGCDKSYPKEIPATGHVLEDHEGRPATCTSSGYSAYKKCKNCSYREGYERYDRLPHSLGELIPEVPATCTSEGVRAHYSCDSCEQLFEQDGQTATKEIALRIPVADHALGEWVEQVDATCDTHGMLGHYRCEVCNFYFDAEKQPMGNPTIVATGHTFGDWYMHTEATCTEGGEERMTCHCGYYISIFHPAKGHTYQGDWYVYTEVSCTVDGEKRIDCVDCDYYDSIIINATGHHFGGWELYTPALCTQNGEDRRYCECGEYEVNTVPATGHNHIAYLIYPTCTEQGYLAHTCHCGDVYKDTFTDPYGHSYESIVTQPTCIEQGYTTHLCIRCNDSYVDSYTSTVGHKIENRIVSATCTEGGYIEHTCTYCGYSYESDHTQPKGHNFWVWETDVQATCTQNGRESRYCTRCKLVEERNIAATGHDYNAKVTQPTCQEMGYTTYTCQNCDDTYDTAFADIVDHSFLDWVVQIKPTCTADGSKARNCIFCGLYEQEAVPATGHDYREIVTEPTCHSYGSIAYKCSCGSYYLDHYIDPLPHTFGEWYRSENPTCTHTGLDLRDCAICGHHDERIVPELDHAYTATVISPTCKNQGYTKYACSRCSNYYYDDYTAIIDHVYSEWEVIYTPTCTEAGMRCCSCVFCGFAVTEMLDPEHIYDQVITPPTCTEQGYTTHTCSRCDDTYTDAYTEPVGHSEIEIPAVEPTYTANGWTVGTKCARCGTILVAPQPLGRYVKITLVYDSAAMSATCSEKLGAGARAIVTAQVNKGYLFEGWYVGDELVSTSTEYRFLLGEEDVVLRAKVKQVNFWDGTVASSFAGGSGTKEDPYLISTGSQLAYLAQLINSSSAASYNTKYYALTADIDLGGFNWDPIGCIYTDSGAADTNRAFKGHFDGRGYTVYNLTINQSKYSFYRFFGLFGVVESGGYVEDVHIRNCKIDLYNEGAKQLNCGGLAGRIVNTTVTRCSVEGNISVSSGYETAPILVGGLVGNAYDGAWISDCYTAGDVYGSNIGRNSGQEGKVGGIAGGIENTTLTRCYSTCYVYAKSVQYAISGGLVGHLYGSGSSSTNVYNNLSLASGKADNHGGWYTYVGKIYGYKSTGNDFNNYTAKTDTVDFYTSTLGWSADVWDFSAVESGGLPTLKH